MPLGQEANRRRNRRAPADRSARWRHARDELWRLLHPLVDEGARVAVVGAGNGDDVPLARLAARAGEVHLVDLDGDAVRAAVARQPRRVRARLTAIEED